VAVSCHRCAAPLHPSARLATLIETMNDFRAKIPGVAALVAVAALTLGAGASAERPISVSVGNLGIALNSGFFPKALFRTAPTPIALAFAVSPHTLDGSHPPALQELTFRFDRSLAINTKGLPACNPKIQSLARVRVENRCRTALVGDGSMDVEIAFPEQAPIAQPSKTVLWNGGIKAGVTRLYAATYLTVPTPAALISTIEIKKIRDGRLGMEMTISIPKIAGGSGSVTDFNARIDRRFSRRGRSASVATLECPDGKVRTDASASFADGTMLEGRLIRTCLPKD
jgi:hypothetical protein